MKQVLTSLAFIFLSLSGAAFAQTVDPKLEWATRVVTSLQGPGLEPLVSQLVASSSRGIVQSWGEKLRSEVPKEKMDQTIQSLNVELKKYYDDVEKIMNGKVGKASADSLIPVYMARFSLDELKQLAAFFELPVFKKHQSAAPEMGNIFKNQLGIETRTDTNIRAKQFDDLATKIVGSPPKAPAAAADAPNKNMPAVNK